MKALLSHQSHPSTQSERLIVTLHSETNGGVTQQTFIWNTRHPLGLGHPLRWVLERNAGGILARDLAIKLNEPTRNSFTVFNLKSGRMEKIAHSFDLPIAEPKINPHGPKKAWIVVHSIANLPSVTLPSDESKKSTLYLHLCAGETVQSSTALHSFPHVVRTGRTDLFRIESPKSGKSIKIVPLSKNIEASEWEIDNIANAEIQYGGMSWKLNLTTTNPTAPRLKHNLYSIPHIDDGSIGFQKASQKTGIAFLALGLLIWLWPNSKPTPLEEQELVPTQFTQIVMSKPSQQESAAASAGAAAAPVTEAKDAQVVQAFRAKALQNSIKGLLKGGMTQLLAQSDIVNNSGISKGAGKIFAAKAESSALDGAVTDQIKGRAVQVAGLGGGTESGTGYAKKGNAKVAGQGSSFIDLDTGASSVAQGLTKDEVGKVIHQHMSEIRYCYESAMVRNAEVEGRLVVDFVIGGKGIVISQSVKDSTVPDPSLDDCVLRRLSKWKFPLPKGGVDVAVNYPFIFKSLGQ